MEYMASWTLILLRLLGVINWNWLPVCAQYTITESYLNGEQRPLWILEDQLVKREREDRPEADYATSTRATIQRQSRAKEPAAITFLVRTGSATTSSPVQVTPQRRFMLPRRVQLPHQYVQPLARRSVRSRSLQRHRPQRRRHQLPIFDNAPGDNALNERNYPIFVYNGTKGELIVNTMLSTQRYPMQEPVPGQVLYPPSTPMFRPKPIVERFRMPGQRDMLNLTLIPFYAHEAIRPTTFTATTTTTTTTETPPTTTPTLSMSYETQLPRSSRRKKMKKAKQYNAYHSPEEVVQWQPLIDSSSPSAYDTTDNHRHFTVSDSLEMQQESQMEEDEQKSNDDDNDVLDQQRKLEIGIDDEATSDNPISAFHIVYVDESLEPPADTTMSITTPTSIIYSTPTPNPIPQSTPIPRQSSRYALKREYFAFPVYTLGKLLQNPSTASVQNVITSQSSQAKCIEDCNENSVEEPNTWFILNSHYKGPHQHHRNHQNGKVPKYYTSKYIQSVSKPRR